MLIKVCFVLFSALILVQAIDSEQMEYIIMKTSKCLNITGTHPEFLGTLIRGQEVKSDPRCFIGCVLGQIREGETSPYGAFNPIAASRTLQHLGRFGVGEHEQTKLAQRCDLYGRNELADVGPAPARGPPNKCQISVDLYNCYARELMRGDLI